MVDPQKCVQDLLLNAPSENAVLVVDLMTWMAEQEPGLKTNSEFVKALGAAQSVLDFEHQDCEAIQPSETYCQNSILNN